MRAFARSQLEKEGSGVEFPLEPYLEDANAEDEDDTTEVADG